MTSSNTTLPKRTLRDPINAFQVDREIKEIKGLLNDLPIYYGENSPEGEVKAFPGALYFRVNGTTGYLYLKLTGEGTNNGWVLVGFQNDSNVFNAGSIIFAGSDGSLTQDNAQLFWDNTNNRFGIGTSSPQCKVDLRGTDNCFRVSSDVANGAAGIEINSETTGNRDAYINLHGDDTNTDFGLRVWRTNAGVNADSYIRNKGTGSIVFSPNDTADFYLPNGGGFSFLSAKTKYWSADYWSPLAYNAGADVVLVTSGSGNAAVSTIGGALLIPFSIPNGSTITAYAVYAYDNNNPGTVSGAFYVHDLDTGSQTQIGSTQTSSTTGTPGNVTLGETGLSTVVDNSTTGYNLYFSASTAYSANLSFRGARVTYTVSGSASMS